MTRYPNREALRKAHDIYRDAMREFIFQYLEKRVKNETVGDLIMRVLNRKQPRTIDIKGISLIFRNSECWKFFSQQFGYDQLLGRHEYDIRSVTSLIVMGRNKVSHPGSKDLDFEYTCTHLFLIAEGLGEIGKIQAKREVKDISDELCYDNTEERIMDLTKELDAAKAENAELKERLAETEDHPRTVESETTDADHNNVAVKVVELRINATGSKPMAWRKIREKLGLKNNEFHKDIRLSAGYRKAVITRIKRLKAREEGWEYSGDLSRLTGIDDITEEELA